MSELRGAAVLVVGAGIMGAGIAQVAAQAGHAVWLFDLHDGAAATAKDKLRVTFDGLVGKGKLSATIADSVLARIRLATSLQAAADAAIVIEAIVEDLDAKRSLFKQLEDVLAADAVFATNTSSISVTAIANGLARPERLVGLHFFNPVALMKLVEVVSGLRTAPAVAVAVAELAQAWGKSPVHAGSTPGFIVNRIARSYYAETLALLQERAAAPHELDACLRGAGFRMGPCELMDLIGHDTNFAVTNSVYAANFFDKRFVPSLLQRELVDGGWLGRKSGRGFYEYPAGPPKLDAEALPPFAIPASLVVHGDGAIADWLAAGLERALGIQPLRDATAIWTGIAVDGGRLALTDGRTAGEWAALAASARVAVFDRFDPSSSAPTGSAALAYAVVDAADTVWQTQVAALLSALGFVPVRLADTPGLVVARTLAMIINEAADAVLQCVCEAAAADAAMKLGVNYPKGPFEWLAGWRADEVVALLDRLDAHYRGERYRASPWLRRRAIRPA